MQSTHFSVALTIFPMMTVKSYFQYWFYRERHQTKESKLGADLIERKPGNLLAFLLISAKQIG